MVGCAIDFFFFFSFLSSPSCRLLHRDEYTLMPRRQGNEISAFSLSLFLFPSLPFRSWWFGLWKQEELFYCYRWKHFVLVSEAPTLSRGLRAEQNLKSFLLPYIISEDYMILAGGSIRLLFLALLVILKQPCKGQIRGLIVFVCMTCFDIVLFEKRKSVAAITEVLSIFCP